MEHDAGSGDELEIVLDEDLVLDEPVLGERALLEAVTRALSLYVRDRHPRELFAALLGDLLDLTGSAYGYVGEVLHDDDQPYLRTWAITDISWNEETRTLYDEFAVHGGGLEFRNLDTLFGWGLRDGGRLVIANDTGHDDRSSGRPGGHPPLDSFLGVPLFRSGQLVGQFGLANRPGGYDQELVDWMEPFSRAIANLIEAHRVDRERIEAQARLEESERRLNSILSHTSGIVTLMLPDGTWVSSSDEAIRSLGYPPHLEPEGGIFSLLHPDDVEVALRAFDEVVAGTRTQEQPVELRVSTADGSGYRVYETTGQDLRDDPAVGGILVTSHDITGRKQTEERLRATTSELHALVGGLRDAVLFVDDDRRVVFANDTFVDLWGFRGSMDDLVGHNTAEMRDIAEATLADPEGFFAGVGARYAERRRVMGEIVPFRDGRVVERDYLPVALDGGESHGHLWLYRDVTARTQMENERQRVLESERQMRAAIEEQNRALRDVAELKNDFVATVSHELRTPLTSIVSFSSLLREESEALSPDQQEFLEIIDRNAERLLHLVGDLLLVANIDSGTLLVDPAEVELRRVIHHAVAQVSAEATRHGVGIDVVLDDDAHRPLLDELRFEQVLANLLSNAVKFTPAGGAVSVTTRREPGEWVVEVADTGIGIPEDEVDRLFERFFRASNVRADQQPGTGLGLVIARSIVELHGGSLLVANRPDGGARVTVRLPDGGLRAHTA